MNLQTLWQTVQDRLAGSSPKKKRQPRKPKGTERQQFTLGDAEIDARINARVEEAFRGVNFTLTNHHNRISELQQIELRRNENNGG